MKNKIKKTVLSFICVLAVLGIAVGVFFLTYTPTVTFDFANPTGAVTSGASGYLYGLAENGVPSEAMCESVDISSVSQKVTDGLQHPIGDVDHVSPMLTNTDYIVVYLQDTYDTWYYDHDRIMQMRADGTYDWKSYLNDDFLPKVRSSVEKLSASDYAEKVVYCLYNECDNGVWFGETRTTDDPNNRFGVWAEYNTVGRDAFNEAWKQTFEEVRSINPDALIGGPGFCDYDHDEIEYFLAFCVENDCVPDVMIYHELHDDSVYYWQRHVSDYRAIEVFLGIPQLPVIVTEYGRMQDNGYPGKMVQYITRIEDSKVYGNNAYWRLSNNLNDVCADDNSPNANWWLMRWYADMEGQTLSSTSHDLFKSDFERSVKNKKPLDHQGFMGVAAFDEQKEQITVVCGGRSGEAKIVFDNLKGSVFDGKTLRIVIEETVYKGLYGVVSRPVLLRDYTVKQRGNTLKIDFSDLCEENAYHVTISIEDADAKIDFTYQNRPVRYEFEHGTLLGNAYLYDSYCPTSGDTMGMVGGMENIGDGVELTFSVPEDGLYTLDFVYGNSNDGAYGENGKPDPDGRVYTLVDLSVDGVQQTVALPNTIKSEYTSCYTMQCELTAGEHTVKVMHNKGTYVLDSLVVSNPVGQTEPAVLPDADRTTETLQSYLAVAPADGYYRMYTFSYDTEFTADGAKGKTDEYGMCRVYLRRGLNYLDFSAETSADPVIVADETPSTSVILEPQTAVLDGAVLCENENGLIYIDGISCNGDTATYTVNAEKTGDYRVTLLYSNNDEGGVHDYNVDLIERYVTVTVNGEKQNVFCRNTYSWETFKTVTFNVSLLAGENEMVFSNDGSIRFDGNDTFAPYIATVTVNPVTQ